MAGPLGTPLGLAQRKRASPEGMFVDVKPQLVSAVSAIQKVGKDAFLHVIVLGLSALGVLG